MEKFIEDHHTGRLISIKSIRAMKIVAEEKPEENPQIIQDPRTGGLIESSTRPEKTDKCVLRVWIEGADEPVDVRSFDSEEDARKFLAEEGLGVV